MYILNKSNKISLYTWRKFTNTFYKKSFHKTHSHCMTSMSFTTGTCLVGTLKNEKLLWPGRFYASHAAKSCEIFCMVNADHAKSCAKSYTETSVDTSKNILPKTNNNLDKLISIEYSLDNFHRSNQDTCLVHKPSVFEGQWVQSGDLLADCSASVGGELALGQNILIAYMPWEGYNFEDAILVSERLVYDDLYTSVHIERYEVELRETKLGFEEITREIPDVPEVSCKHLNESGIAKLGSWVEEGDILVGKVTPINKKSQSNYQKLLYTILDKTVLPIRDSSLRAPKGIKAKVIGIQIFKAKTYGGKFSTYGQSLKNSKNITSEKKPSNIEVENSPLLKKINFQRTSNENPQSFYDKKSSAWSEDFPTMQNLGQSSAWSFFPPTIQNLGLLEQIEIYNQNNILIDHNKFKFFSSTKFLQRQKTKFKSYKPFNKITPQDFTNLNLTYGKEEKTLNGDNKSYLIKNRESEYSRKDFFFSREADNYVRDYDSAAEKKSYKISDNLKFLKKFLPKGSLPPTIEKSLDLKSNQSQILAKNALLERQLEAKTYPAWSISKKLLLKGFRSNKKEKNPDELSTDFLKSKVTLLNFYQNTKNSSYLRGTRFCMVGTDHAKSYGGQANSNDFPEFSTSDLKTSVSKPLKYNAQSQLPEFSLPNKKIFISPLGGDPRTPSNKKKNLKGVSSIQIFLAEKRRIQVGDKMAGRHGNKGIISQILPIEDMPFLPDGRPLDMVLNPLGVPSRMNVGQIYECLLGLAGKHLGENFKVFPFDEIYGAEASRSFVYSKLYAARTKTGKQWLFNQNSPGKIRLYDGRTGETFDQAITVGYAYMLRLVHMVDDKIHARSTGPYSLVTQQPLRGRSKQGGQRLGEMEVWALEGYGAAFTLLEMLTIKSDDMTGRMTLWSNLILNKEISIGTPESFKVLICELQALCLDIGLFKVNSTKMLKT